MSKILVRNKIHRPFLHCWVYFTLKKESLSGKKFLDGLFEELKTTEEYIADGIRLKKIVDFDLVVLCKK